MDSNQVPTGMSYAEIARTVDGKATALIQSGQVATGGLLGPIVSGMVSAVCRAQLASMPPGTQSMQVLQTLAPIITNVTGQLVAIRDGTGQGAPKIPPANLRQAAFEVLQKHLSEAAVPTFVITVGDDLVLLSLEVASGHVRAFASLVDVEAVRTSVRHVLEAHVTQAVLSWGREYEALHLAIGGVLAGLSADEASTILLEHLAAIVVRSSTDLPTALSILQGFSGDLETAVKGGWLEQREGAGHG